MPLFSGGAPSMLKPEIPRLEFDELPDSIARRLRDKYERLGYLGEFFAATAHQEAALAAFIDFTEASKGELDIRLVELVVLTVACLERVDYERNQHERLALKLGLPRRWVAEVERLDPDRARLDEQEKIVQRFVLIAVERRGRDVSSELSAVVDELGYRDAVAVLMLMARYVAHALLVNSLGIAAPVPSIFAEPSMPGADEEHKP
ncbi:MAG: carboxymuconolactone decarboxylase family protein [Gammaproteobacteria bacterium]|nr:MAG: carboxymuconolactone decarboxylase family protein [Gammaproteobacteria bacterium]